MTNQTIQSILLLAETNWDAACGELEQYPGAKEYFETWARHCGAPKAVFIGHTLKMLKELGAKRKSL